MISNTISFLVKDVHHVEKFLSFVYICNVLPYDFLNCFKTKFLDLPGIVPHPYNSRISEAEKRRSV